MKSCHWHNETKKSKIMSTKNEKHLYYLSELSGYKITTGDHDIRGWIVKDLDNRIIGKVDNLLINKDLEKVVYIDVEIDKTIIDANHDPYSEPANPNVREFINKDGENHLIIPIGLVSLNPESEYVYTETIDYQTFAETKRYQTGNTIDRDYERAVLTSYNRKNRRNPVEENPRDLERTKSAYNNEDNTEHLGRKDFDNENYSDKTISRKDELTREEIAEERLKLEREKYENDRLAENRRNQDPDRNHDYDANKEYANNLDNDYDKTLDRDHDRLSRDKIDETTEERIRREKANMKYKSDNLDNTRLDEPVVDHNTKGFDEKWRENTGSTNEDFKEYQKENTDTSWKNDGVERPVRTFDEDKNWSREEKDLERDETFENDKRIKRERERDDDFYDRNEFRNRNY